MSSDQNKPSTFPKHFDTTTREPELSTLWEKHSVFKASTTNDGSPVFNLASPPPNANGELHLGHALGHSVMDIMTRFYRSQGYASMLIPGKDHAGIQTQVVFEKKLKSEGVDISKRSTADLWKECYSFCLDRAEYMRRQERRLGFGADYSKELFTLDPRLTTIIYETFTNLWNEGLVYRGPRIVNWSVFSQTSISDVEVEYKEMPASLWYVAYPLADGPAQTDQEIKFPNGEVRPLGQPGLFTATTRPETLLGDTALAVHPDDERYKRFIGSKVIVPLVNRAIPVIADKHVDPTYGTGVIKVTPAHDFNDYEMGQTHKLETIQVIGKDGRMTDAAGPEFSGLTTLQCREKVLASLTEVGLLLDETSIIHKVPIGERGKDVIEPLISEQWWVAVDKPGNSLRQRALDLVRSGKIQIHPARFKGMFEQWLENLHDWNISRQLWWGQRLPVWYRHQDGKRETYVGVEAPKDPGWEQETDVFDTWFSSGQWAFSTVAAHGLVDLNVPNPRSDHFPTHSMVMGRDILLFWACRMLLLTAYRCKEVPWKNIYFTGLIRDEHGQKMSKSKGNGIDPLVMMEKYGTDALRLALVIGGTPGNDISFSQKKIEGYSKFVNKIWNAAKLIDMKAADVPLSADGRGLTSRWILGALAHMQRHVQQKMLAYDFAIALDELYGFAWTTYCDWYLEFLKVLVDRGSKEQQVEARATALVSFKALLAMLHPFVPFVSEEIYQTMPYLKSTPTLAQLMWQPLEGDFGDTTEVGEIFEIVGAVRSVRAAMQADPTPLGMSYSGTLSDEGRLLVSELARIIWKSDADIPAEKALPKPLAKGLVTLEVEDKQRYLDKLKAELAENQRNAEILRAKLAGDFGRHAKPEIIVKERERLEAAERAILELGQQLTGSV